MELFSDARSFIQEGADSCSLPTPVALPSAFPSSFSSKGITRSSWCRIMTMMVNLMVLGESLYQTTFSLSLFGWLLYCNGGYRYNELHLL